MRSDGPLFEPRQSPLRVRQRSQLELEGEALIDALLEDLATTKLLDTEVCERTGTDRGHFARVRAKQAHPSQALVAFAVDHSRHRPPRYLVVLNSIADYEPKPRPPPDLAAVLDAYRDVVAGMDPDFDALVRAKVERKLGVVLAPAKHAETTT
jgi:hypothetical protein